MKADKDIEDEIRRIAAEENLIRLKVMAKREEREARREEREMEMEARREEEEREERQNAKEKEMEEARYTRELELLHIRAQLKAQTKTETTPARHKPVFNVFEAQRLIPRFTEESPDKFFDHFETVGATMKQPEDKWSMLLQSVLFGKGRSAYLSLSQTRRWSIKK
ncbi:uncharacterized protein [Palaemon carinicauda]|uniref:uncharacterized protein n=1 Tax=Palaemon carinicauda TaxID=392227 RepID=UPI0035B6193F